jgi:hypothetical protein
LEWEHVCSADFDAKLNPIKMMAVTVSGNHGAVFIDMAGTVGVDRIAGQLLGVPGTNNVTMQNQLLVLQSGLLALVRQDNLEINTAINVIKLNLERCFGILNGNIRRIELHYNLRSDGLPQGRETRPPMQWRYLEELLRRTSQ